jgi:hypothetical protein
MARGFGGETTAQEARGNEGLSSSDIAGGRQDAATSAMASGRDVDPGGGNDGSGGFLSNDYTPDFNRVSQIQDIMQAQETFNRSRGITDTNPFGSDNIFTKYLGIDPKNIDYTDNISRSNRISIANNQFSKFMNPQNKPGMVGYNPDFPTAGEGQLRAGAQSAGYKTQFGDVMGQARKQSTGEMIARGLFGLTPLGPIAAMLGTQEYGLPGQPGFDSFDPNNPRQSGGILSTMLGGLNPTQAKEAMTEFFSAPVAAPTKVGIESLTPASYETRADIAARTSKRGFAPPAANIQRTTSLSPSAGEQLAMGFKGLESGYSQQVYDELRGLIEKGDPFVQPGNENMYGTDIPGVFDQDYNRNLGPVSGLPAGSFDVAGSGGRTYQSGYQGQGGIYSPGGKGQTYYGGQQDKPFFDKFGTTAQEALDKLYGYVTG